MGDLHYVQQHFGLSTDEIDTKPKTQISKEFFFKQKIENNILWKLLRTAGPCIVESLRNYNSITCCFKVGKSKSCIKKPNNGKFNFFLHHSINCQCWFYKSVFAMISPTLPIRNRVDCLAQIIKTRVNSSEVSLEGAVILIEFVITIT